MKTNTLLHIETPCNENWNNMTATEKGRFCDACKEQVIDFTAMTDRQVLEYLAYANGKVCGRIHTDQLQRALHTYDKKKTNIVQWAIAGVSSLFFSVVKGQTVKTIQTEKPAASLLVNGTDNFQQLNNQIKTVKGTIVNEEQEAILNARVTHLDGIEKILVNKQGAFVMQTSNTTKALLVSAEGYNSRVVPTSVLEQADTSIVLTAVDTTITGLDRSNLDGNIIMGGITTFTEVEKRDTPITFVKKILNNNFFKIHPNPANKNGVNISISKAGTYTIQIFDNNSRLLHTQEVIVNSKGQIVFINFNGCLSKGTYYIRVVDKQSKKQYTDKLLVQ